MAAGIAPVAISPRMRLDDVIKTTDALPFGGTDCALPMLWAADKNVPVDVFCVYTDSETWAGDIHPVQALRAYRQKTGIGAKLVVIGMVSNGFTIADPNDAGMLDVVGFDTATPSIISDFATPTATRVSMSARTATCREAPGPRGTNAARAPFFPPRPAQRGEGRGEGSASSATTIALFKWTTGIAMYIRFTIPSYADRTPDGSATGIFRAVWQLAVDYRFEDWAFAVLDDDLDWFQEHLPVPNNVRGGRALCWFRPEAREVIRAPGRWRSLSRVPASPYGCIARRARNGRLRGRLPGRSRAMARHIWLIEPPEDFDNPIAVLIWRS